MCTLYWDNKLTPTLRDVCRSEEHLTVVMGDFMELTLFGVPGYEKRTNKACRAFIARLNSELLHE